jgi:hypothetical protein
MWAVSADGQPRIMSAQPTISPSSMMPHMNLSA